MKLLTVDTIEQVKGKLDSYFTAGNAIEEVALFDAVGRYLAEGIACTEDIPGFDRSVVDGYAVVAKDTFGVSDSLPVFLDLSGEVEMGESSAHVEIRPGKAAYVPTGGMLPAGADAVVMVEFTEKLDDNTIAVYKAEAPGGGVMGKGHDFKNGTLLYEKGHRVTVKDVGMMAALGKDFLNVYERPSVSIISTGDEVVSIVEDPGPGQVRDINSYALAALVLESGGKLADVRLVKDSKEALLEAFSQALMKSDIVLLSGGSSAGNKDMTAEIIDAAGNPGVIVHGIAMKPGKPTIVGVIENGGCCCCGKAKLAVGLPGHPMAAIIAYKAVVDFFMKKYYFCSEDRSLTVRAEITENIRGGEGRETFLMVRLLREGEKLMAVPIHAKSGSISQLRHADGFIRLSHLSEGVAKGALVEVTLL